ncbi:MAG: SseB family protein [Rhodobacteraceae bacterium]|nr:SseB family protein [Paracoccaceae bacterium]
MAAAPEDEVPRRAFHACLASTELYLLLAREAGGGSIEPRVFPLGDGPVVLAFDSEERLAGFAGAPAPYAALPGRVLAALIAGHGLALGLNLDVAPSAVLLPPEAVDWVAATLAAAAEAAPAPPPEPAALGPAPALQPLLAGLLDRALAGAAGLAAWAAMAGGPGGRLVVGVVGARPGVEGPLARALAEAAAFAGAPLPAVVFAAEGSPLAGRLDALGPRRGLAPPTRPPAPGPAGPEPTRPPILRPRGGRGVT